MQAKARINGFRPGKVPVAHLKRLYGRSIMADVVQEAVNEAQRKIVEDNKLRPAAQPKIDFPGEKEEMEKAFEAKADFAFTVALEVLPKIEVGSFEDIEIERLVAEVADERDRRGPEAARRAEPHLYAEGRRDGRRAKTATRSRSISSARSTASLSRAARARTSTSCSAAAASFRASRSNSKGMTLGESRTVSVTFSAGLFGGPSRRQGRDFRRDAAAASARPAEVAIDDDLAKSFGLEDLGKLKESIKANIERDYAAASRRKWKRGLLDALDKKYAFDLP